MKMPRKKTIFFFTLLFLTLPAAPLYPQTETQVERATRSTDRLLREGPIEEKLREVPPPVPKAEVKETPAEKKETKFFVKKINLTGCESFPAESFAAITAKYENKEIGLTDLANLGKEIEAEYLRRGIIAAILIPPQEIKEQAAALQAVEARMGRLQIQDAKYFRKQRLAYYWAIKRGEILRYDKMSKSLQLANKNPDRKIKAALHAGKKPGRTDVLLTPETNFPVHATGSFSNEGSTDTGKSIIGYGVRHNNFLGLDDSLLANYTFGRDFNGLNFYHLLPVSPVGTSLIYGYSRSVSIPTKELTSSGIESKGKNITATLNQDLYNSKGEYFGEAYLGFDAKDKVIYSNTGVYSKDRLRIFKLGTNLQQRGFGDVTYLSGEVSQGVAGFGASKRYNPLASRGAKSTFTKFNLELQYKRMLPLNLQGAFRAKGQLTSVKLTPQEQFSLGGIDSVRGYPAGDYSADAGATSSVELLMPATFIPQSWRLPYAEAPLKDQTTFLAFVDYGYGMRRAPSESDKSKVTELGMGAGARFNLYNQALLRLEWGFPIAANRPITQAGKSQFHFTVDVQDRIPAELERILKLIEEENIKQWAQELVDAELAQASSPLRQKMIEYLNLAETAYLTGRLREAKEFYAKVGEISKSLFAQAEDYVRGCVAQKKELQSYCRLAAAHYKEGRPVQAKGLWEKVIAEAHPRPFTLEF